MKKGKKCWHKKTKAVYVWRSIFPFGRKSKPVYTKRKYLCERCAGCGEYLK